MVSVSIPYNHNIQNFGNFSVTSYVSVLVCLKFFGILLQETYLILNIPSCVSKLILLPGLHYGTEHMTFKIVLERFRKNCCLLLFTAEL